MVALEHERAKRQRLGRGKIDSLAFLETLQSLGKVLTTEPRVRGLFKGVLNVSTGTL